MQKLILLLIFLASQEEEAGMMAIESTMTLSICQLWTIEGACNAEITIMESPSMENFWSFIEAAREAASASS
jgi:hypothetical protein